MPEAYKKGKIKAWIASRLSYIEFFIQFTL